MNGAQQIEQYRAAGFTNQEISEWEANERKTLNQAGFSLKEIDEHFGIKEPNLEGLKQHVAQVQQSVMKSQEGKRDPKQAMSLSEYFEAGWQMSATGLASRGKMPDVTTSEQTPMYGRIASQVATLAGDFPFMIAGGAAGAPAGATAGGVLGTAVPVIGNVAGAAAGTVVGAGAGAFAAPELVRQTLMQAYEKGEVASFADFWERASTVLLETGKAGVIGGATAGAGGVASKVLAPVASPLVRGTGVVSAEIATMVTVGAALEGKMPEPHHFTDAAILIGGMKGAVKTGAKLREIYSKTGKTPAEVVQDIEANPSIKQDILSRDEGIPTAYRGNVVEEITIGGVPGAKTTPLEDIKPQKVRIKNGNEIVFEVNSEPIKRSPADQALLEQVNPKTPEDFTVRAKSPDGKEIGYVDFEFVGNGKLEVREVRVDPNYRRQGVASKMYDMIEAEGFTVNNAKHMTDAGKAFQEARISAKGTAENPRPPESPIPDPAQQAVLDRISVGEKEKPRFTWDQLYTMTVNDLHPLFKVTEQMAGTKDVPVAEHPGKLAQLTRGAAGKADQMLEHGTYKYDTYETTGKSLKAIIEPVKNDLDGMRAYAVAARTIELEARGVQTGVPLAEAKQVLSSGKGKYDKVMGELQQYQNSLTEYLRDAGLITKEAFTAMQDANKNYVPFHRLIEGGKSGTGKGMSVRDPIKGIKGSEREILDPIESIIKNTYLYTSLAERNAVGRALVDMAEKVPNGAEFLKKVPTSMRPVEVSAAEVGKFMKEHGIEGTPEAFDIFRPGSLTPKENEIVVFRNGKREIYEVDKEVAAAFKATDRESANLLVKILAAPARTLRAGSVLSPEFMSRNVARDQMSAFVLSKNGYIPVWDMLSGAMSLAKKDDHFQNWLKSGGANAAMVSLDRNYLQTKIHEMADLKATGLTERAWNVATKPIELLRVTSELLENSTRLGEFKRATGGATDKASLQEGGFAAREVTLDFARMGAKTQSMNMITAFWNAHVQGLDRTVRAFGERPFATTAKIGAAITVPSILLFMANKDDPRWDEIPRWQKDLFWIVMTDETIYRIPKPFEVGVIFGSGPERMLEAFMKDNPKAFKDFEDTLWNMFSVDVVPTAATPVIEQFANRSMFTGHKIVPASQEGLLPEYQYNDYTTELTKTIGRVVGTFPGMKESQAASPAIIDNYIRGWTGGLGNYALQIADKGLREAGVLPDPVKPASTLADIPVIKAFVIRYPSASAQSIQDFYDKHAKHKKVLDTIKYAAKEGNAEAALRESELDPVALLKMDDIKEGLNGMSQLIHLINKNPEIKPEEKRQLIDATYHQMIELAKAGNQVLDEADKILGK